MTKKMKTTVGISAILITLAIAAVAFAHGGGGYGRGGYGRHMDGYGGHMMGYGGHMMGHGPHMRGKGAWGDLPEETQKQVQAAREAFHKDTRQLRGKIEDSQIDLRDELRQETPDINKVAELQKALSGLQAEFDQKAVIHRLEMRKLTPEDYRGRGYGRGYGGCR